MFQEKKSLNTFFCDLLQVLKEVVVGLVLESGGRGGRGGDRGGRGGTRDGRT